MSNWYDQSRKKANATTHPASRIAQHRGIALDPLQDRSRASCFGAMKMLFSALDVFSTAWPDALAIVAELGPRLRGAWIVGHSAGALPALLAGIIGGAHRVDIYGVPSAVGPLPLDGEDGIAHLYTDSLDPTGVMGWIRPDGSAAVTLGARSSSRSKRAASATMITPRGKPRLPDVTTRDGPSAFDTVG